MKLLSSSYGIYLVKNQLPLIFLSLTFFISSNVFSAVYKWVDADGKVHYTNKPTKNATEVNLPPSTTYTAANAKSKTDSNETAKESSKANKKSTKNKTSQVVKEDSEYNLIEIIKPEEGVTIRNDQGEVKIEINLSPTLGEGHVRQLILDNTVPPKIILPTNNATLSGVERGKHQFVLEIKDAKGKVVGKSAPRKFVLRKAAVEVDE